MKDVERAIIHLNIADFAVAVETNLQPALKGYPVIIAPMGAPRAVVYDMSDEAFQQGIRKGMPLAQAKRINKKAPVLPPYFNRYETVMKHLLKETTLFTPLVESGQTDGHIFLDVTGSSRLFGPPVDMAFKLKKIFQKEFNLTPVWSVATNKLIAKVATRVVKPAGEYIVAPGDEQAFLAPLPLRLIPGFEKADLTRLHEFNLFKVKEAEVLTKEQLEIPFDKRADQIHSQLKGIDSSPVIPTDTTSTSFQADHEFQTDTNNRYHLKKHLYQLVEQIGRQLRQKGQACCFVQIILSYSDGLQTRAHTRLKNRTFLDMVLFETCFATFKKAQTRRVRIRHIRLVCQTQPATARQATLFEQAGKTQIQTRLMESMDAIRKKFGAHAIQTGLTLMPESDKLSAGITY